MGTNLVISSQAQAAPDYASALDGWCDQGEVCFYYNSNNAGAIFDVNFSIANYGFPVGDQTYAKFVCSKRARGDGPLCNGAGQRVWNNAASVYNNSGCDVVVYYNSNYDLSNAYQVIPRWGWANLSSTMKNQNASHKFLC
ncbi:peptidase inhibitor family I36 protein [Kitasatospora sp. NPDC090091]|uniref:peptidase inhibitor family I36 protein n=1 Tax=Kitasatospora sp. NPDC090091 TaxID=3364081 RepID=UPI00382FFE29